MRIFRALDKAGGRFGIVLLIQVLIVFLAPQFIGLVPRIILNLIYYSSLMLAIYFAGGRAKILIFTGVLSLYCFVVSTFLYFHSFAFLFYPMLAINLIVMIIATAWVLWYVLKTVKITANTLSGAVFVYFMAAMVFAFLYLQIERIWPGSFYFSNEGLFKDPMKMPSRLSNFLYFSFTTITTLGFGDFTPIKPIARATTIVEAIFGELYLAIFIARIVGIQITQTQRKFIEETQAFFRPKK
jgi:hypothetical protein